MSGSERDPEFEDFLRRRSPMHRRLSDFDHAEPSVELDRLVLSRAREAIETPAQPPIYRATRWAMPVGLAATILLAFSILLSIGRHQPARQKQVASTASPVVAAVPAESQGQAQSAAAMVADEAIATGSARARDAFGEQPEAPLAASAPDLSLSDRPLVASARSARVMPAAPSAENASHADVESWLREIARLRAEGKTAEAERELLAFRQAYPGHAGTSLAQPPTR